MTADSDTISNVLKNVATTSAILGVMWVVLKDKIAADLAPKLELFFTTKTNSTNYRGDHQKDHRLLETQIATVAEHKALQAINPLTARVDTMEKQFSELTVRVEASRKENREDFSRLFERLDEMNESIIRINAKHEGT